MNDNVDHLKELVRRSTENGVASVDEMMRVITRLEPTLQKNPDVDAYKGLVEATGEVSKTWEVIETAITNVLTLYNEEGVLLQKSKRLLWDIDSDPLPAFVKANRGQCHRINEIYQSRLQGWFEQTISHDDQDILYQGFYALGNDYDNVFYEMDNIAGIIDGIVRKILDLLDKGQPDEARAIAEGLYSEIRGLRRSVNTSKGNIEQVQRSFSTLIPEEMVSVTNIVQGDQITVGNITNATGVAIGREASSDVN